MLLLPQFGQPEWFSRAEIEEKFEELQGDHDDFKAEAESWGETFIGESPDDVLEKIEELEKELDELRGLKGGSAVSEGLAHDILPPDGLPRVPTDSLPPDYRERIITERKAKEAAQAEAKKAEQSLADREEQLKKIRSDLLQVKPAPKQPPAAGQTPTNQPPAEGQPTQKQPPPKQPPAEGQPTPNQPQAAGQHEPLRIGAKAYRQGWQHEEKPASADRWLRTLETLPPRYADEKLEETVKQFPFVEDAWLARYRNDGKTNRYIIAKFKDGRHARRRATGRNWRYNLPQGVKVSQ
eukprot:SAG31_NODE_5003_length_2807_cov_2.203471_1_plen_295_part_10